MGRTLVQSNVAFADGKLDGTGFDKKDTTSKGKPPVPEAANRRASDE